MTDPKSNDPPAEPDFEQSLGELERIAGDLETGDLGLEAALSQYERGVRLLKKCHEVLERAERRIELLSGLDADGKPIRQEVADVSTLHAQAVRLDASPTATERSAANGPRKSLKRAEADDAGEAEESPAERPAPRKAAKKKRAEPIDDTPRGKARALFTDGEAENPPDDRGPDHPSDAPF